MDAIRLSFFQLDVNYGSLHFQVLVTLRAPGYREERVRPVRFGGPDCNSRALSFSIPLAV
jgi:hypothetical protein